MNKLICKAKDCHEPADIRAFGHTKTGTDSWFCLKHWLKVSLKYYASCSANESPDGDMFRLALERMRGFRDGSEGDIRKAWARAVVATQTINEKYYKHMRIEEMGDDE